jgi:hypothetical protein
MNRQLTVQQSRHRLARKICHGNRGQIRQASPAHLDGRPGTWHQRELAVG